MEGTVHSQNNRMSVGTAVAWLAGVHAGSCNVSVCSILSEGMGRACYTIAAGDENVCTRDRRPWVLPINPTRKLEDGRLLLTERLVVRGYTVPRCWVRSCLRAALVVANDLPQLKQA